MEQKEAASADKAAQLVSKFEKSFRHIQPTFHPPGVEGEIAGKSSNVAFAAQRIIECHQADLKTEDCKVVVTVMDGKFRMPTPRKKQRPNVPNRSRYAPFSRLLHRNPSLAL